MMNLPVNPYHRNAAYLYLIFLLLLPVYLHAQDVALTISPEIRRQMAHSRVVMLGEPTHGEGNVFRTKTALVQYLHDSLGFNIIAFESGLYDVYYANGEIAANPAQNVDRVLDNALFPIWMQSTDFSPFLHYYEQQKHSLKIAGFDCQLTGAYSKAFFTDSVFTCISRYNKQAAQKISRELLQDAVDAFSDELAFPEDIDYKAFCVQTDRIITALRNIDVAAAPQVPWYLQGMYNIRALGKYYYDMRGSKLTEKTFRAKDSNPRDSMMAQNLLMLLRQYPHEKIICWGAGTHFMNDPSKMSNEELQAYKPMGMYLKKALGEDKVFNLTFISSGGAYGLPGDVKPVPTPEKGSIEQALSQYNADTIISLRSAAYKDHVLTSYCLEYTPLRANWSALFDAFVYLRSFTPNYYKQQAIIADNVTTAVTTESTNNIRYTEGVVKDAVSGQGVAFAGILVKGDKNYGTQSNNNGDFRLPDEMITDSVYIYSLGYRPEVVALTKGRKNTILLKPVSNRIEGVTVSAARVDVKDLLEKVKEHYDQNYGAGVFRQTFYVNKTLKNFDTVVYDKDYVLDNYEGIRLRKKKTVDYKEAKTNKWSADYMKQAGMIGAPLDGSLDFIRNNGMFKGGRYKQFSYKLVTAYSDSLQGTIYKLAFSARKNSFRYTNDFFTRSYEGTLLIRKADYAVLQIEVKLVREVVTLQRWTEKHFTANNNMWRIFPESEIEKELICYARNPADGLYYVKYANTQWQERGYFMDGHQAVKLSSDYSHYSIGEPVAIPDGRPLPFDSFRFPQQAAYHPDFWQQFIFPQKNNRIYQAAEE